MESKAMEGLHGGEATARTAFGSRFKDPEILSFSELSLV